MANNGTGTPAGAEIRMAQESWQLPRVVAVEAVRVTYSRPRRHLAAGKVTEHAEAVEVTIRTDGPIPVRALAATLHIGDVVLTESEPVGPNLTRFIGFDFDRLQNGTEIALGWWSSGAVPQLTGFRFKIDRTERR